jgi:hypothetical protein
MDFSIVTDTVKGSNVEELSYELEKYLSPKLKDKYPNVDLNIGFAFRCLPETHRYKSFVRYTKKDKELTIDIYFCSEHYNKMCKAEQRFHLGNTFIEYLRKAFEKRKFDGLDSDELIEYIIKLGSEMKPRWFDDIHVKIAE